MTKRKKPDLPGEAPTPAMEPTTTPINSQPEADLVDSAPDTGFPVVGIGASAGGLREFEDFFSAMPLDVDPGMAFVLVQHLAPEHKSLLVDLVKRYTRMPVCEVKDGMVVQPNCVYIIPPNRDLALLNGALQLLELELPRGQHLPIDFFFRSLAQDQHEKAICIIFSGTGRDGTLGARAVKGEGGMVMVQNPESAEFDGMPSSVIATGMADYVMPAKEMPAQLIAYAGHTYGKSAPLFSAPAPNGSFLLKKIFVLLHTQTGHDFSQYKQNTIRRRIERRMTVHQISELSEYVRFLQQNSNEVQVFFDELLIGVTNFFRDTDAFAALESKAVPHLFNNKQPGTTIRVWCCGCSTGEEAYSIAIVLQEQMEKLKIHFKVQIFATDIDSRAIDVARIGSYPASIALDVSAERLARFFTLQQDNITYRINKSIRDTVNFSKHDVIKDPPFSKLDMVSCRNLLIYLGGDLQKKLIPLFQYALRPDGILFLGSSETVGEFEDILVPLDRQWKLFQCKEDVHGVYRPILKNYLQSLPEGTRYMRRSSKTQAHGSTSLRELTERILLQHYKPVGALISECGEILYLCGRTGRFLEPSPGEASLNILKMSREGLRHDLTAALYKAAIYKTPVFYPGLMVKTNGDFTSVNLSVLPVASAFFDEYLIDSSITQPLFLVILEDTPMPIPELAAVSHGADLAPDEGRSLADVDGQVAKLQLELQLKEEYLQANIEELDTSNEEMQAINEELQSANEELETSQEELQSVNEELSTVNAELQSKVVDLSNANNDMSNLLAGSDIGTIFVDHQLRIKWYAPAVTSVINLIPTDVGRPLGHIVSNLSGYSGLLIDVQEVLDTLIPKEFEVQTAAGQWYLLRIRPYRTIENVIEGAVIIFVSIHELKKGREAMRRSAAIIEDSHDAILLQDLDGRILAWNRAAQRMYGWSEAEALTMNIRDLIAESELERELAQTQDLLSAKTLKPYRTERRTKDGQSVKVWMTATSLLNEAGQVYAIAMTERELPE